MIFVAGNKRIGFEIKYSNRWQKDFNKGLRSLLDAKIIHKGFGIYTGDRRMIIDGIEVLPFRQALARLGDLVLDLET